ncbi:ATPdependent RNA helicase [Bulinus truncatus]|nr:ATPdependent RNA helicase [Bulinus truncatus]
MPQNVPDLIIDSNSAEMIRQTLQSLRKSDQTTHSFQSEGCMDKYSQSFADKQKYNLEEEVKRTNKILYTEFQSKAKSASYQRMQQARQRLPAWEMKEVITAALEMYNVVVISGVTGCGKTTQVPQFILDEALQSETFNANIICTQPRRISAISVAERVAHERDDDTGKFVGYQIKLESKLSIHTRLLFCTTGIVLRRLEDDPELAGVTHVVVDEVHERSEQSDFLLLVLKKLLVQRPDLRVILMSATIDTQLFSDYFGGCPVIEIPGKMYPVKQFFLEDILEKTQYRLKVNSEHCRTKSELRHVAHRSGRRAPFDESIPDMMLNEAELRMRYSQYSETSISTLEKMDVEKINYELLFDLLEYIVTQIPSNGAILVFLPGLQEIQKLYDMLKENGEISRNNDKYVIIPLHSSLTAEAQKAVFCAPRPGIRKIVLSTNIAETSVTIDDIVFVVDTGKMKEKRFDPLKSMQSLDTIWVSKTNALQRMGRAGRVQQGVCFHMFTSHMYQYGLREQNLPEIQRNSIEQVVIRTKILPMLKSYNLERILSWLINPPDPDRVQNAIQSLIDLGALDSEQNLTALGYHVGSLPVDVRIGKLILYGAIFRCLDSILTIAACLSFKSPFNSPFKKKEEATEKKKEFETNRSDILTMLNAYKRWWNARENGQQYAYFFCKEYFLSFKTLEMLAVLKQEYVEILSDIGFIKRGIRLRDVQAASSSTSDGVVEVTGLEINMNNDNMELLSSLLVAALYPNIMQAVPALSLTPGASNRGKNFKTRSGESVDIHPGSVNFKNMFNPGTSLVYHEKVKTTKVYIRDSTVISKLSLLMFAGGQISVKETFDQIILSIDRMIKFKVGSLEKAYLLQSLRSELDKLLFVKMSQPNMDIISDRNTEQIIPCIVKLLLHAH